MVRAGLGLVAAVGVCVGAAHGVVITFNDPVLKQAVRDEVGIPTGDIEDTDVAGVTHLFMNGLGVSDFTGLEFFSSLQELQSSNGGVTDLTPISGLTTLLVLDLQFNPITNFTPLTGLSNLVALIIGDDSTTVDLSFVTSLPQLLQFSVVVSDVTNPSALSSLTNLLLLSLNGVSNFSDVSVLSGLTNLTFLALVGGSVSDISALSGLTNLTILGLDFNDVSDIAVVQNFPNLTQITLTDNPVSDLSPIAGLTAMDRLVLDRTQVTSLGALSGLTNLEDLDISNTGITDFSVIENHPNLRNFYAENNGIADLSTLATIPTLEQLVLLDNAISDVTALSGLANLFFVLLRNNNVADILPLLDSGLGAGDLLEIENNPLNQLSLCTAIPALEARGVTLSYDGLCGGDPATCPLWPLMDDQGRDAYDSISLDWNFADPAADGIPDRWQVRLVAHVLCRPNHPLHALTDAAYQTNRELLLSESNTFPVPLSTLAQIKELLSALLLMSQASQDTTTAFLGLDNDYIVVDGFAKAPDEPFAGDGDLDGDGFTNQQEYDNIIANGGTLENFVSAATDPALSGMESFPAASIWALLLTAVTILVSAAFTFRRAYRAAPSRSRGQ